MENEFEVTIDPTAETVAVEDISSSEETGKSINWKVVGGIGAAAGIATGIIAKKFGPGLKATYYSHKQKVLDKRAEKIANQQLAVQVKLNNLSTPEPEATKEA